MTPRKLKSLLKLIQLGATKIDVQLQLLPLLQHTLLQQFFLMLKEKLIKVHIV
jgi:hypothetical protein